MTSLKIQPCDSMPLFVEVIFCSDQREFSEFVDGVDREEISIFQVNSNALEEPEKIGTLLFQWDDANILENAAYQASRAALTFASTYISLLGMDEDTQSDDEKVVTFNSAVADATSKLVKEIFYFHNKHFYRLQAVEE